MIRIPLTGALGFELGDHRATGWGNVEELLAALVELTDGTNRLLFRANTKKGVTQPKPIKVPRPSGEPGETEPVKRKRPATSEELKAFFGGAVRYTGPKVEDVNPTPGDGRPRDARGRFVKVVE